jgi:hypothetical protein
LSVISIFYHIDEAANITPRQIKGYRGILSRNIDYPFDEYMHRIVIGRGKKKEDYIVREKQQGSIRLKI